jgi:ATP-dependent helicase/nuclease subunit B
MVEWIEVEMANILQLEQFERFSHTAASRYFIERAKRIANFVIGVLIDNIERSEFVPTYFEKTIQVGLDKFDLRGKIDRIDIKDNRFTVIDYKTGSKTFDLNSIYQGIDLQLTLYADAFRAEQSLEPAGLFYFNIKDPIVDQAKDREKELRLSGITAGDITGLDTGGDVPFLPTEHISDDMMDRLTKRVRRISQTYIDRIDRGEITIKPIRTTYLACDYCEYSAICRFDRMRKGFSEERVEKLKKDDIYARLMTENDKTE